MSKTSYEIPFNSPIANQTPGNQGMISHPWQQWTGNMGTAMNTVATSAKDMNELTPTSTLADVITAWEELRANLKGLA